MTYNLRPILVTLASVNTTKPAYYKCNINNFTDNLTYSICGKVIYSIIISGIILSSLTHSKCCISIHAIRRGREVNLLEVFFSIIPRVTEATIGVRIIGLHFLYNLKPNDENVIASKILALVRSTVQI